MNEYQLQQYLIAYIRDDYTCQKCGKPATQIAHRINQSKVNIKKYGEKIINNHNNLVSVCSLYCNGSYNIGFRSNRNSIMLPRIK